MRYEGLDSDGKLYAIFWFLLFTTLTVVCITIAVHNYNMRDTYLAEKRIESQYKMACLQSKGSWESTDGDRQSPYSCKVK